MIKIGRRQFLYSAGTIIASQLALQHSIAFNISKQIKEIIASKKKDIIIFGVNHPHFFRVAHLLGSYLNKEHGMNYLSHAPLNVPALNSTDFDFGPKGLSLKLREENLNLSKAEQVAEFDRRLDLIRSSSQKHILKLTPYLPEDSSLMGKIRDSFYPIFLETDNEVDHLLSYALMKTSGQYNPKPGESNEFDYPKASQKLHRNGFRFITENFESYREFKSAALEGVLIKLSASDQSDDQILARINKSFAQKKSELLSNLNLETDKKCSLSFNLNSKLDYFSNRAEIEAWIEQYYSPQKNSTLQS